MADDEIENRGIRQLLRDVKWPLLLFVTCVCLHMCISVRSRFRLFSVSDSNLHGVSGTAI